MLCSSYNIVGIQPVALVWPLCCMTQFSVIFRRPYVRKKHVILDPVHTYPDIFESLPFSFRIRLPSTSIRWIRHTNPQLFESILQTGFFLNTLGIRNRVDAKSGYIVIFFLIQWRHKIEPSSLPWIFKTAPCELLLLFLNLSFKSYNLCPV